MIYLNNTATSYPKPVEVLDALRAEASCVPGDAGRSSGGGSGAIEACRFALAAFLGASSPEEVVLTPGATVALNLVLNGIDYSRRRRVVSTAAEHNAVLRPLYALERKGIIDLVIVPCGRSGIVQPAQLSGAVDEKTAAIVITEASNVTGAMQDLAAASEIATQSGALLIVDGAQGGGVSGIQLRTLAIDAYVFAGHKNFFGMEGTGGVILRRGLEIEPLIRGGTGRESGLHDQPEPRPHRYEAGTGNRCGAAALTAGVHFLSALGQPEIQKRLQWFTDTATQRLRSMPHINAIPIDGSAATHASSQNAATVPLPVLSFTVQGMSPAEAAYCLENSFGIRVRAGLHCAPLIHGMIGSAPDGTVRASPSILTPHEDWEALFDALATLGAAR